MMRTYLTLAVTLALSAAAPPVAAQSLSAADVDRIVGQAVAEASAQGKTSGAVAVVDRVGNVLGVYTLDAQTPSAAMRIDSGRNIPIGNGLEQVELPAFFGAIAKAITGAYLSSSGNAFTTRTASQIVQENFLPGESGQPSGPLFGVQFSQLPCSDIIRFGAAMGGGPRRSPLGLSADVGGLPLYQGGQVVGGVGVLVDGIYGLDLRSADYDRNVDELVAIAAQRGFEPPRNITERITADGKVLRYSDVDSRDLKSSGAAPTTAANYLAVPGYTTAAPRAGAVYGTRPSGIRAEGRVEYPDVDAWVLDDGFGANRYTPRAALSPAPAAGGMAAPEVRMIVSEALKVAFRARAQIRRPVDSFAQVTVSVVDAESNVLAIARTPDAPVFGIDVSLQKARSAAFLSRPTTAAELRSIPAQVLIPGVLGTPPLSTYMDDAQRRVSATLFANGLAFSDRSMGLLTRPNFPDGLASGRNGPFSTAMPNWSPFNVGLQLDLVIGDIVTRLNGDPPAPQGCTALPQSAAGAPGPTPTRLANGLQIFPGSVPIYRNDRLIGAVGVSGDGVDQDEMVAFLGLHNAGQRLNSGIANASLAIRPGTFEIDGIKLRYVQCPFSPFLDSRDQNVCAGK
jgi:uncharacterized protein GlcG (DUF336 family)